MGDEEARADAPLRSVGKLYSSRGEIRSPAFQVLNYHAFSCWHAVCYRYFRL
jgi:hypothetical protein